MSKTARLLCAIGLLTFAGVGCGDDDDASDSSDEAPVDGGQDASTGTDIDASVRPDGSLDASNTSADAAVALSEAQVVGLAAALNNGEIAAGTIASGKATAASVKNFAAMMVTMHTAANERAKALGIAPADSAPQNEVETMAASVAATLQSTAAGAGFDSTYIETQVVMHTAALSAFDRMLLPNAKTPALVADLQTARSEVVTHLAQAQALRSDAGL
jgi:putative membrane protein